MDNQFVAICTAALGRRDVILISAEDMNSAMVQLSKTSYGFNGYVDIHILPVTKVI